MNKPKPNSYTIRHEVPADYRVVEELTRQSFWNVYRPGCLEHYVLHRLRQDPAFVPELDYVLEHNGRIIGHVMFMHAELKTTDGRIIPIMTFGPISIAPDMQRLGYGKALLDYALNQATLLGAGAICMEGNIDFYGKCGFVVASSRDIHYYAEPPEAVVPYFLLNELRPGFLTGVSATYHTPQGYLVDSQEAEAFDQDFPPLEKKVLPGQIFPA